MEAGGRIEKGGGRRKRRKRQWEQKHCEGKEGKNRQAKRKNVTKAAEYDVKTNKLE